MQHPILLASLGAIAAATALVRLAAAPPELTAAPAMISTSAAHPSPNPRADEQLPFIADHEVTAEVRKAVLADASLSSNAKNAQIITTSTTVVLRGAIDSIDDKSKLVCYARALGGRRTVVNELEISAWR